MTDARNESSTDDESVWTEFTTDLSDYGTEYAEQDRFWGAKCPQPDCEHVNIFEGDPGEFANRPYACINCHWISLMDSSVAELGVTA